MIELLHIAYLHMQALCNWLCAALFLTDALFARLLQIKRFYKVHAET